MICGTWVCCADFRFHAHDAGKDARATFALVEWMVNLKFFMEQPQSPSSGSHNRSGTGSIDEFFFQQIQESLQRRQCHNSYVCLDQLCSVTRGGERGGGGGGGNGA